MIDENSAEWREFEQFIRSHAARLIDVLGPYVRHLTYSQDTGLGAYRVGMDKYIAQKRQHEGRRDKAIAAVLTTAWTLREDFEPESEAVTQWFDRCCARTLGRRAFR